MSTCVCVKTTTEISMTRCLTLLGILLLVGNEIFWGILGFNERTVLRVDSLVVSLFIFAYKISHNFFEMFFLVWTHKHSFSLCGRNSNRNICILFF